MHCKRFASPPLSRRAWLQQASCGFGSLALAALAADTMGQEAASGPSVNLASKDSAARSGRIEQGDWNPKPTHHAAKARSVIFLYMDGGVSQIDSFDPKPRLEQDHGKPFAASILPTQFNNVGTTLASPWKFHPRGQSGLQISELFPSIANCADDLAIVRSMTAEFSEHNTANFFLHTGTGMQGRPSMGAWFGYGLGSVSQELPGYVVINGGLIPSGGLDNFGAGFLPASYQGTIFKPGPEPLANLTPPAGSTAAALRTAQLMRSLDQLSLNKHGTDPAIEAAISNYELAYRMQIAVPELADLSKETAQTQSLYGLDAEFEPTRIFAAECLLARRMVERGVRFIELTCPRTDGNDRWDAHSGLVQNHGDNARAVDQPIAALLTDLKARGLLASTLVVFTGEFGRTPFAQGSDGRDHNPYGFSLWMAGGGVKGGVVHGATDEFGYHAIADKVNLHDLHATMLHLLGLDHKRVTFRWGGRDMRLTDVHGELIEPILH